MIISLIKFTYKKILLFAGLYTKYRNKNNEAVFELSQVLCYCYFVFHFELLCTYSTRQDSLINVYLALCNRTNICKEY